MSREQNAKVYLGPLLTGEKLVDNAKFKEDLLRRFPTAVGGEMESAGVYAAAHEKKIDWIIIKRTMQDYWNQYKCST